MLAVVHNTVEQLSKRKRSVLITDSCGQIRLLAEQNIFDPLYEDGDVDQAVWSGSVQRVEDLHSPSVADDVGIVFGRLVYKERVGDDIP